MSQTLSFLLQNNEKVIENAKKGLHYKNYCIFNVAYHNFAEMALRWLLFLRDKKQGLGQREAFKGLLIEIANRNTELAIKLFRSDLVEFGRFDDEITIYDKVNSGCRGAILDKIRHILKEDLKLESEGKEISMLAKWMPSINTSSKQTRKLANMLREDLLLSPRQYRKILSRLRKHLNLLETNLSKKTYSNIEYDKISPKMNQKYNDLFLKNDFERRTKYLKEQEKKEKMIQILKEYNQKEEENISELERVEAIVTGERYNIIIDEILNQKGEKVCQN